MGKWALAVQCSAKRKPKVNVVPLINLLAASLCFSLCLSPPARAASERRSGRDGLHQAAAGGRGCGGGSLRWRREGGRVRERGWAGRGFHSGRPEWMQWSGSHSARRGPSSHGRVGIIPSPTLPPPAAIHGPGRRRPSRVTAPPPPPPPPPLLLLQ